MKKLIVIILIGLSTSLIAQNKGYEKSIEVYGGFGLNELSKYQIGISMINGYRLNDFCYFGIGIGIRYQESRYYLSRELYGGTYDSRTPCYHIPLNFRVKFNLTKTDISPFLSGDIGTNVKAGGVNSKTISGFFFEPLFGVDIKTKENVTPYFAVGINVANAQYKYFHIKEAYQSTIKSKATTLVFHIGFKF